MCGPWLDPGLNKPFWGPLGNFSHGLDITQCSGIIVNFVSCDKGMVPMWESVPKF